MGSSNPPPPGSGPVGDVDLILGERVRRMRMAHRMSQADLAAKLGVSAQQVQKYERGSNRISAATLVSICNALEVQSADMLSGFSEGKVGPVETLVAATPQSEVLLKAFAEIDSPAVRAALLHLAKVLADDEKAS